MLETIIFSRISKVDASDSYCYNVSGSYFNKPKLVYPVCPTYQPVFDQISRLDAKSASKALHNQTSTSTSDNTSGVNRTRTGHKVGVRLVAPTQRVVFVFAVHVRALFSQAQPAHESARCAPGTGCRASSPPDCGAIKKCNSAAQSRTQTESRAVNSKKKRTIACRQVQSIAKPIEALPWPNVRLRLRTDGSCVRACVFFRVCVCSIVCSRAKIRWITIYHLSRYLACASATVDERLGMRPIVKCI